MNRDAGFLPTNCLLGSSTPPTPGNSVFLVGVARLLLQIITPLTSLRVESRSAPRLMHGIKGLPVRSGRTPCLSVMFIYCNSGLKIFFPALRKLRDLKLFQGPIGQLNFRRSSKSVRQLQDLTKCPLETMWGAFRDSNFHTVEHDAGMIVTVEALIGSDTVN